jgi:hypothetical protein
MLRVVNPAARSSTPTWSTGPTSSSSRKNEELRGNPVAERDVEGVLLLFVSIFLT